MKAFVFDPDRCTGCEACRVACGIENGEGRDTGWRSVSTFNPARYPALPSVHLSLACNHCDIPACALGCPAAAYERDEATGAVLLDPGKCIGCRYCSWLCPYDAPAYDGDRGVMTKCTFCSPRLAAGSQPACTQACPTGALSLGERDPHPLEPSWVGLGSFGLGPALKIVEPRRPLPPALAIEGLVGRAGPAPQTPAQPVGPRKITLGSEWALALFTVVMPALVAWLAGGLVDPSRFPPPFPFLFAGAGAMLLSMLHLGRPLRAWRAIVNVRTSWLSREILSANLFLAFAAAALLVPALQTIAGWCAVAAGVGLAVSIDGVYRSIARSRPAANESAEALPMLAFLIGVASGVPVVAWGAAGLRTLLFLITHFGRRPKEEDIRALPRPLVALRLALLFGALVLLDVWPAAFLVALAGEAIDRGSFYARLEPSTPARRMREQMRAALAAPGATRAPRATPDVAQTV